MNTQQDLHTITKYSDHYISTCAHQFHGKFETWLTASQQTKLCTSVFSIHDKLDRISQFPNTEHSPVPFTAILNPLDQNYGMTYHTLTLRGSSSHTTFNCKIVSCVIYLIQLSLLTADLVHRACWPYS